MMLITRFLSKIWGLFLSALFLLSETLECLFLVNYVLFHLLYTCICLGLPFPGLYHAFPLLILASTLDCLFLVRFMPFYILYSICICFGLPFPGPFRAFPHLTQYLQLLWIAFSCFSTSYTCISFGFVFSWSFRAFPPLMLAPTLNCLFPGTVLFHLLYFGVFSI